MKEIDRNTYDQLSVKLLRVLRAVDQTRSTYRAAEQLFMSQSAVARSLEKLRAILKDPLYIKKNNKLIATQYCQQLNKDIPQLIDNLFNVINQNADFNPQSLNGTYEIALNSPCMTFMGVKLMERLTELAPNACWKFSAWNTSSEYDLETGKISYGLQYLNPDLSSTIYQKTILQDECVLAVNANHPLVNKDRQWQLKSVADWPMIYLSIPGWNDYYNHINHELSKFNLTPHISCSTDNMNNALEFLENSNYIMVTTSLTVLNNAKLIALKESGNPAKVLIKLAACYRNNSKNSQLIHWLNQVVDEFITPEIKMYKPDPDMLN